MPINGDFKTPLLNGALFHQSTFRDLFGIDGVSFTAGLRLDYEKMKMDYNSGTAMDYTIGITGQMMMNGAPTGKPISMMPETALTVTSRYQGSISKDYLHYCRSSPCNMSSRETSEMYTPPSAKDIVREDTTSRCSPTCCKRV